MNNLIKKGTLIIGAIFMVTEAQAALTLTLAGRGAATRPADATINIDVDSDSATGPKLSSSGSFSSTSTTGFFEIDVVPYANDSVNSPNDFNPLDWSGLNDNSVSVIGSTGRGWGVDTLGEDNVFIQDGEALVFSFDFSGLNLALDDVVVLKSIETQRGTLDFSQQTGVNEGTAIILGDGSQSLFDLNNFIIDDGDVFAFSRGTRNDRVQSITLDVVDATETIPEPSALMLLIVGVGALIVLRRKSLTDKK